MGANEIRAQEEPEMSVFPTKILLATDGSENARPATEAVTDLADRSQSELHVVHVWHDVPGFAHAFVKRELRRQGQEILDEQVQRIEASGGTVTQAHLRGGRTSDEIIKLSEELGVGLLVVGSRGLGTVQRILMGSHSEEIVHHARVPVLVVRRGESAWPPSRVIIGEDFSGDARKAGELAASIGALYGSRALLVYAHPKGEAAAQEEPRGAREQNEDRLESRADELGEILGSRPEILVSDDHPAAVLLEAAHQQTPPSLIAVGSRGIAGIRRTRLGSVSTKIVTASPGPVLVCPHVEQARGATQE
jgi:nucleotide-binding universal stress UspA family protein